MTKRIKIAAVVGALIFLVLAALVVSPSRGQFTATFERYDSNGIPVLILSNGTRHKVYYDGYTNGLCFEDSSVTTPAFIAPHEVGEVGLVPVSTLVLGRVAALTPAVQVLSSNLNILASSFTVQCRAENPNIVVRIGEAFRRVFGSDLGLDWKWFVISVELPPRSSSNSPEFKP